MEVAIPFSSGLCSYSLQTRKTRALLLVAIPFSSGLCSYNVDEQGRPFEVFVAIPFSSGLCSYTIYLDQQLDSYLGVAIPFSSGLCSYAREAEKRGISIASQSLFLQVFVPTKIVSGNLNTRFYCRNPFFFRSLFLRSKPGTLQETQKSQSLFLQVFVPTLNGLKK